MITDSKVKKMVKEANEAYRKKKKPSAIEKAKKGLSKRIASFKKAFKGKYRNIGKLK